MRKRFAILILAAAILTPGCNQEIEPAVEYRGFTAMTEPHQSDSKTSLSAGKLFWSAGDTIAVYPAAAGEGARFGLDAADDGQAKGRFNSQEHPEYAAAECYALYPASMDGGKTGSSITVNLPAVQEWRLNSFGPGANPAVAHSSGDGILQFKNLCGLLSVNLNADEVISEVKLTTLGDEALWGSGTVDMTSSGNPALVLPPPTDEAHKSITLKVNGNPSDRQVISAGSSTDISGATFSGTAVKPTLFHFVVPAGALSKGFVISVVTSTRQYMQKFAAASGANTIERSVITVMPQVDFVDGSAVAIPADIPNKAYYKDFLIDTGIGLSDYKTLSCTERLKITTETLYARTNDNACQTAQNSAFIGNENDENGILLYPDGEPRFRMIYVNGGQSYTHGPSLMAAGRDNFRTFVYNGGSYLASCAGSYIGAMGIIEAGTTTTNAPMMAYNGYLGLWPGLVDNTGLTNAYPDYTIPKESPLLKYDNFGGDYRVDSIKQWNGPYFSEYASVPGTEVLAYFDYPAYRCHNHPSIISYKPSAECGRITLIGGHPEQYTEGEATTLMDALVKYSLDGRGCAKVKGILHNGEVRQMTKSTSDRDPAHTKVGDKQCHNFAFALPQGARNIKVRLEVKGDFNVSLRLAKGTFAFREDAQHAVENEAKVKDLSFDTLEAGTYYIGVQCEDTVTNDSDSKYGISYSGKLAALNGAPYSISVSWE